MTYNEWRDELRGNLLGVTENERQRVLDYYAEAYADRREAGFSEREIIEEFGAPYDAAQRILSENKSDENYDDVPHSQPRTEKRREERGRRSEEDLHGERFNSPPPPPVRPAHATANNAPVSAAANDNTWIFVLLCILFAPAIFGLVMGMAGVTVGFCVAPIAIIGSGAAAIGSSIGTMIGGDVAYGLYMLGGGIITIGIGIMLCPLFFKLVQLMWQLFKKFFSWLKGIFSDKESI